MNLQGQRVLITGGSRGIGRALASELAARGAHVTLAARTEATLREAAAECGGDYVVADLAEPAGRDELVARAGRVDVFVSNAGYDLVGAFTDTDAEELRKLWELNVIAPSLLTRALLPQMLERASGRLVFMSSLSAEVTLPGFVAYSATKAAITQLATGLHDELRETGVGVTLVEIGAANTEMYASARSYAPTAAAFDRANKLGFLRELEVDEVVRAIVRALERDRGSVILPRRGRSQWALSRAPHALARAAGLTRARG